MAKWLEPALDYVSSWLAFKVRQHEIPGLAFAAYRKGKLVHDEAFGVADLATGAELKITHQFRIASHSKTFTACGIMRLVEAGRLRLDDRVRDHVQGLHTDIGAATLRQLLSHTAGVIRDGTDAGQWEDRRPFLSEGELRAALAEPPILPANTRMKYSNHGFGLLGLVMEAATGEPYAQWMAREVVARAGLKHVFPDAPTPEPERLARGHGAKWLTGARPVIPADNPTRAMAAATGFIAPAAEVAAFFAKLDPGAESALLSTESRREMTRRHWRAHGISAELHYGLGTIGGDVGRWPWFGHSGGFQGFTTHTACLPGEGLTLSILTNAVDAAPGVLFDGAARILQTFAREGPPAKKVAAWRGRWWYAAWGAYDFVPMGKKVLVAFPTLASPFLDATELEPGSDDEARIVAAGAFGHMGEGARLVRGKDGGPREIWLGGTRLLPEKAAAREIRARYAARS